MNRRVTTRLVVCTLALLAGVARATDYVWQGSDKSWDDASNGGQTWWYNGGAPAPTFAAANQSGNKLTVGGSYGVCFTGGTVCDAALYLYSGGILRVIGNHTATNLHLDGGKIYYTGYQTDHTLSGLITVDSTSVIQVAPVGDFDCRLHIGAVVKGSANLTIDGRVVGGGIFFSNNNNPAGTADDYSGNMTVIAGYLVPEHANALGTGNVYINNSGGLWLSSVGIASATLYVNTGGFVQIRAESVSPANLTMHLNGGKITSAYGALRMITGTLYVDSDSILDPGTGDGGQSFAIGSQLVGSNILTKTGTHWVTLANSANASTYTGTINEQAGVIQANPVGSLGSGTVQLGGELSLTGPVIWDLGTDLSGSGSITRPYTSPTTTMRVSGRSVRPGTASSRGTVRLADSYDANLRMVFAPGNGTNAELRLDIAATNDYDKLLLANTGADALTGLTNCNLFVNFVGRPVFELSDAVTIVELTGAGATIGGTRLFANVVHKENDDGDTDTWLVRLKGDQDTWQATINYSGGADGNDVVLTNMKRILPATILVLR